MRKSLIFCSLAAIALVGARPAVAHAQRGGPPFGGPRGGLSFDLSDGEPVSFYLEWARELEVTDDQRAQLIELRRRLRVSNAPFMKQLDSLRQAVGISLGERGRVSQGDAEALRRFQEASRPITDSIKFNNDGARADLRTILQPLQLARADSLFKANPDNPRSRRAPRQ